MCTFSKCSEVLIMANVLKVPRMICVGSKAMFAVSIDLFTNINRNIQQTDMLCVLDVPDFYIS